MRAFHILFGKNVLHRVYTGWNASILYKLSFFLAVFLFAIPLLSAQNKVESGQNWPELDSLISLFAKGDTSALSGIQKYVNAIAKEGSRKKIDPLNDFLTNKSNELSEKQSFEYSNKLNYIALALVRANGLEEEALSHELDIAFNHRFTNYPDSTFFYLKRAERYPLSQYSSFQRVVYFNTKGVVAADEDRYLEAIEWYQKALNEIKDEKTRNAGSIKENIGVLFFSLKNYRRAISYMHQAEKIFEYNRDTTLLARLYPNLGVAYMRVDSLDKAAEYHRRASALATENSFGLARSLANLGNVLRRQGRLSEALQVIDSSSQICTKLDISFGFFINLINKSNVLLDMKKPAEALRLLNAAMKYPFWEDQKNQLEIYDLSGRAHEMLGNIERAFDFQKKYLALKNSLEEEEGNRIVMEWEENLLREQKDHELDALNLQLVKTRQRQQVVVFSALLGLLLAFAISVILFLRKQKQDLRTRLVEEESETLRLQLELKERELASQSIHLQSISGFAEDISNKLGDLKQKLEGEKADELNKIIKDFENGIPEELWEDFRVRFEKVNDHFYQKLLEVCPELTPVEIKIASFLRLNLSSKEISRLTNRSAGTISNTRSSLRKKLKLEEEDNLIAYLMSL